MSPRQCKSTIPKFIHACALVTVLAACDATSADVPSAWSSGAASLTTEGNTATVHFLASGNCYGSYGVYSPFAGSGSFVLTGTFTQLTGVFPGSVSHPAEFSGNVSGDHMTLTVTVPATQQVLGPFNLTGGTAQSWTACLYP